VKRLKLLDPTWWRKVADGYDQQDGRARLPILRNVTVTTNANVMPGYPRTRVSSVPGRECRVLGAKLPRLWYLRLARAPHRHASCYIQVP